MQFALPPLSDRPPRVEIEALLQYQEESRVNFQHAKGIQQLAGVFRKHGASNTPLLQVLHSCITHVRTEKELIDVSVQAGLELCFPAVRLRSQSVSGIRDIVMFEMYLSSWACQCNAGNGALMFKTLSANFPSCIFQLSGIFSGRAG